MEIPLDYPSSHHKKKGKIHTRHLSEKGRTLCVLIFIP